MYCLVNIVSELFERLSKPLNAVIEKGIFLNQFFWAQNAANMHPTFDCSIVPGQPPPQALRFSQGRGERLVMNRKGPWEGYRRQAKRRLPHCLLPSFLCPHIFIERERDVWVRGRSQVIFISDQMTDT